MHTGECAQISLPVTDVSQTLDFPEILEAYKPYQNCKWILILSDPGKHIEIEFESFATESCCDYLAVIGVLDISVYKTCPIFVIGYCKIAFCFLVLFHQCKNPFTYCRRRTSFFLMQFNVMKALVLKKNTEE